MFTFSYVTSSAKKIKIHLNRFGSSNPFVEISLGHKIIVINLLTLQYVFAGLMVVGVRIERAVFKYNAALNMIIFVMFAPSKV